jgi:transcription factor SPN1
MFLYKHPLETKQNKKMAKFLIEKWSRPIFGISAKYQDLNYLEEESSIKQKKSTQQQQQKSSSSNSDSLNSDSGNSQFAKKVR